MFKSHVTTNAISVTHKFPQVYSLVQTQDSSDEYYLSSTFTLEHPSWEFSSNSNKLPLPPLFFLQEFIHLFSLIVFTGLKRSQDLRNLCEIMAMLPGQYVGTTQI